MKQYLVSERVIGRIADEAVSVNKSKTFLQFPDREITYSEFGEAVNRVANSLSRIGINKGDKVAVMLPNSPEFVFTAFALAKIGAISVPVNTAFKGDILEYILNNSESQAMVLDEQFLERVSFIATRLKKISRLIIRSSDSSPGKGLAFESLSFARLFEAPAGEPAARPNYSDVLSIMYTSGTTGPSKGVMIPHCQACTFALDWLKITGFTGNDILYTTLPLFHVVASHLGVLPTLITGAKIVVTDKFSATRWWDEMRKYNVTVAHCLTSMMNILLSKPESPDDKNHRVRTLYMGGSSLSPAIEKRFGATVLEPYGATESGLPLLDSYGEHKAGTCGKENAENFEVRIADENDMELPPGEKGELLIRPRKPYVMMVGYYNMPDATIAAFRNLWFHTGDRLYQDKEGWFYFVDRVKEVIRRRGENISSYEIERAINSHPSVVESAAIPVPSELGEDEVKVCIVLKEGHSLAPEELLAHCEKHMPLFWIPRYVEFKNSLPKTETSKVQKFLLRREGNSGITIDTWDRNAHGYKLAK